MSFDCIDILLDHSTLMFSALTRRRHAVTRRAGMVSQSHLPVAMSFSDVTSYQHTMGSSMMEDSSEQRAQRSHLLSSS